MATTTTNTTTTTNGTTTTDKNNLEKFRDWAKGHVFSLFLIAMTLIAGLALMATGFTGSFRYSGLMGWIVGFFNVAILIYPGWLALKDRRIAPLVIMALSIVYAFIALPIEVRVLGAFGSALWSIPLIGPIVLPASALILNAVVAWIFFVHEPKSSVEEIETGDELDVRRIKIATALSEFTDAGTAATTLKVSQDTASADHEKLLKKSTKSAEAYKKADKAFATSPAKQKETKVLAKKAANQSFLSEAGSDLTTAINELRAEKDAKKKKFLEDNVEIKRSAVRLLENEAQRLESELLLIEKEIETSPEKAKSDARLEDSDAATKKAEKAQKVFNEASEATRKADTKLAIKAAVLEKHQAELDTAIAHVEETVKSRRTGWVKSSVVTIGLQVAAFVLYTSWFGWVLLNFSAI